MCNRPNNCKNKENCSAAAFSCWMRQCYPEPIKGMPRQEILFESKKRFYAFSEELCGKNISFTATPSDKKILF